MGYYTVTDLRGVARLGRRTSLARATSDVNRTSNWSGIISSSWHKDLRRGEGVSMM